MVNALMVDLKAKQHDASDRGQHEPSRVKFKERKVKPDRLTEILSNRIERLSQHPATCQAVAEVARGK